MRIIQLHEAGDPFADPAMTKNKEYQTLRGKLKVMAARRDAVLDTIRRTERLSRDVFYKWQIPIGTTDDFEDLELKGEDIYVRKTSPLVGKLKKLAHVHDDTGARMEKLETRIKKLRLAAHKEQLSGIVADAKQQGIPDKQLDSTILKKYIKGGPTPHSTNWSNPYFEYHSGKIAKYAGHPAYFPWFGKHRLLFLKTQQALKNNGLPELNRMYALVFQPGKPPRKDMYYIMHNAGKSIFIIFTRDTKGIMVDGNRVNRPDFISDPKQFIHDGKIDKWA